VLPPVASAPEVVAGVELTVLVAPLDVVPVVAVDVVAVALAADVDAVAPDVVEAGDALAALVPVSALTSAWKSCCSFDNALSPELDEDPDELVRLCSRF
jgi:hypothetical protein